MTPDGIDGREFVGPRSVVVPKRERPRMTSTRVGAIGAHDYLAAAVVAAARRYVHYVNSGGMAGTWEALERAVQALVEAEKDAL